jgi:hypothetical protein
MDKFPALLLDVSFASDLAHRGRPAGEHRFGYAAGDVERVEAAHAAGFPSDPRRFNVFLSEVRAHQTLADAVARRAQLATLFRALADVERTLQAVRGAQRAAFLRAVPSEAVATLYNPRVSHSNFPGWVSEALPGSVRPGSAPLGPNDRMQQPDLQDLVAGLLLLALNDADLRQLAERDKPAGASIGDAERAAELAGLDRACKEANDQIRAALADPARRLPDGIWQGIRNFFGANGDLPECFWPCWYCLLTFNARAATPCDALGRRASPELAKLIQTVGIPVGTRDNRLFMPNDTIRLGKSSSSESARPRPQNEAPAHDPDAEPSPTKYTPLSPILTGQTNRTRED